MNLLHNIKPIGGINVDVASEYLKPTEVRYALNLERMVNNNSNGVGSNAQKNTPAPASIILEYQQPAGINTAIGRCVSKKTNEIYVFVHNSLTYHHIYRINGRDNTTQMVLLDPQLAFKINPRHQIRFRAHLFYNEQKVVNALYRKYLVWTEGSAWQGFLDVETSIATGGFRTAYYFTLDRTQLWQLPTRPSLKCVYGDFEINTTPERSNRIKEQVWLFRVKFIYTDGRPTAWGPIPSGFVELSGCKDEDPSSPRCINLRIDAGGPHVEKVVLAYGNCLGNFTDDQQPQFYQTDIINKYEDCLGSEIPFYTRRINPNLNYDIGTNTFLYKFCNEGTCIPIARAETDLNFVPVPKTSYALMPQEDKLALLNNEWGDDPLDCRIMSQMTVFPEQIVTPNQVQEMITLRVAVIIHQMFTNNNVPIFVYEDLPNNEYVSANGKRRFFGGLVKFAPNTANAFEDPGGYEQYFTDQGKEPGFIIYIEGTGVFGVTKQYKTNGSDDGEPYIEDNFLSSNHRSEVAAALLGNEYYYYSVAEIKVPRGTRGVLRLGSHLSVTSDKFEDTSTNVLGVLNDRAAYLPGMTLNQGNTNYLRKEIYFDTCGNTDEELDLTGTPFVIADLTGHVGNRNATAFAGYVKDSAKNPVANATVAPFGVPSDSPPVNSSITDWNGYYFSTALFPDIILSAYGSGVDIIIEGPDAGAGCAPRNGGAFSIHGTTRPNQVFNGNINVGDVDYETNYLQPVRIKVVNTAGQPISGVPIAQFLGKAAITNAQGEASFNIRRFMPFYPMQQSVRFIMMQKSGCLLINDSDPGCLPEITQILPLCFRNPVNVINLTFGVALRQIAGDAGYHPGGVYPIAIKLIDPAGRETFAEKVTTIVNPEMQATGQFGLFRFNWQINGPMNLPREYTKMAILVGRNTAFEDFTTWVADKVTYVDSSGGIATSTNADKILVSIKSLFDNAFFYGFGTNVRYQFVPGDRLEIITDKNGKLYSQVFNFLIEADYNNRDAELAAGEDRYSNLVITFDKNLVDFDAGSQIKIIRPTKCKPQDYYFETCDLIDIVDGEPVVKSGIIGGYDTYMLRRSIRYDNMTHNYGFPFMHHSPSDFWGDHCQPRGRLSVTNPYTRRIRYERNMKISGTFLVNGLFNGLAWYDDKLQKNFSGEQRGAIVAAVSMEKIFMCICEYDNLMAQTANDFARVDPRSGNLVALSGDQVVSDAESKIVGNFGCQYDDVGSIEAGDGWVSWIDTFNKCPVFHNWQVAKDASMGRMQGYFTPKLTYIYEYNITASDERKIRIVSGYDCVSGNILFTFFDPVKTYRHSRHEFATSENETIALSAYDGTFPTAYGFTPENYCSYDNSVLGSLFIAFKHGKPWLHRVLGLNQFNTFFGEASDQVFEPVINERPEKVKIMLAMQQITNHPYYIDRIITSNGHTSILPPAWVKKFTEGKYDAEFLQAQNKKGGLFNGPALRGHWVQVRYVRDNTINNIPGTLDSAKQGRYNELERIIVKTAVSEQSAYST